MTLPALLFLSDLGSSIPCGILIKVLRIILTSAKFSPCLQGHLLSVLATLMEQWLTRTQREAWELTVWNITPFSPLSSADVDFTPGVEKGCGLSIQIRYSQRSLSPGLSPWQQGPALHAVGGSHLQANKDHFANLLRGRLLATHGALDQRGRNSQMLSKSSVGEIQVN